MALSATAEHQKLTRQRLIWKAAISFPALPISIPMQTLPPVIQEPVITHLARESPARSRDCVASILCIRNQRHVTIISSTRVFSVIPPCSAPHGSFFKTLEQTEPVKKYQLFGINSFLYNYPLSSDDVLEERINECITQYQSHPFHGFSLSLNYHPVKSLPPERLYRFMNSLLTRLPVCCSYHVRDQQDRILESIQEVMSWHKGTAARCHISHLKFGGVSHKGLFPERYQTLLEWQKNSKFPLSWDTYPFAFASTTLTSLFPTTDFWQEQSEEDVCQWLVDNPPPRLAETTVVCDHTQFNQKTLGTIASELEESLEKALLTICRTLNGGGTYQRAFCEEEDLLWLLAQPETFIASDSFGLGQVHPRCTDTFTTVLFRAWQKGEQALCELVQRLQNGAQTVFPENPQTTLAKGQAAELFFFMPKSGSNNQPDFLVRGTIIGNNLFRFD